MAPNNTPDLRPAASSDSLSTVSTTILDTQIEAETQDLKKHKEVRVVKEYGSPTLLAVQPPETPSPISPLPPILLYGPSGPPPNRAPPPVPLTASNLAICQKQVTFAEPTTLMSRSPPRRSVSSPPELGRVVSTNRRGNQRDPRIPVDSKNERLVRYQWIRQRSYADPDNYPPVELSDLYQCQQRQPLSATLPPATKMPARAARLETDLDKEAAVTHRSELMGKAEHARKIGTVGDFIIDKNGVVEELVSHDLSLRTPSLNQFHTTNTAQPTTFTKRDLHRVISESTKEVYVFSISIMSFRRAPRSEIFHSKTRRTVNNGLPDAQCPAICPPLLVDGRMTIQSIPRLSLTMDIYWRYYSKGDVKLRKKTVPIPAWLMRLVHVPTNSNIVFVERGEKAVVKEVRETFDTAFHA